MEIPSTVFIALGAIVAAVISGGISFVNLIISKEQKTSEFRQKWIDSLRNEISKFTSHAYTLTSLAAALKKQEDIPATEKREIANSLTPNLIEMKSMYNSIILRLNPKEHNVLIEHVNELNECFEIVKDSSLDDVNKIVPKIIKQSQKDLKKEWHRVRRGETAYCITKYFALVLFFLGIIFGYTYNKGWVTVDIDFKKITGIFNKEVVE